MPSSCAVLYTDYISIILGGGKKGIHFIADKLNILENVKVVVTNDQIKSKFNQDLIINYGVKTFRKTLFVAKQESCIWMLSSSRIV